MLRTTLSRLGFLLLLNLVGCAGKGPSVDKKAELTIAYQSQRWGALEPCGCQSKPYGGIDREFNALKTIRSDRDQVLYVDAGNSLVTDGAAKSPEAFEKKAKALAEMLGVNGLDALLPGPYEFALGVERLKKLTASLKFPLVLSNATEAKKEIFPASVIVSKGNLKIAILGVVSPKGKFPKGVVVEAPKAAIGRQLVELKGKVDLIVLLSQLSIGENEQLAAQLPEVNVVVSADPGFSGEEPLWIGGKTLVVDTHVQGYLLGRLDLNLNFPLLGFYSPAIVEKNQQQLAVWEQQFQKNPGNKIAAEMVRRMKADDPLVEIPGGSVYRHELISLDSTRYGEKNGVSELIQKEKERITREARNQ